MIKRLPWIWIVAWLLAAAVFALADKAVVHADPQPALDRQLVERMTRALEEQAHATEALVRATERCKR